MVRVVMIVASAICTMVAIWVEGNERDATHFRSAAAAFPIAGTVAGGAAELLNHESVRNWLRARLDEIASLIGGGAAPRVSRMLRAPRVRWTLPLDRLMTALAPKQRSFYLLRFHATHARFPPRRSPNRKNAAARRRRGTTGHSCTRATLLPTPVRLSPTCCDECGLPSRGPPVCSQPRPSSRKQPPLRVSNRNLMRPR
jgi:hypothetical protein